MKFIIGLLLMMNLTMASEFTFNVEQAKTDDLLARSKTDIITFNVGMEYDLTDDVFAMVGYSFGDGDTSSFGVNKYGTTIDSTTHKTTAFMIGIGFRF